LRLVYYNKDKSEFRKKDGEFQGNEITKEKVFGRVDNDLSALEHTDIKRKSVITLPFLLKPHIFK
jgi:hypothetical protein